MPKFILPKPKKGKKSGVEMPATVDEYYPRNMYIPANAEIVGALTLGDVAEVRLVGKVIGLESRKREGSPEHSEFQIELESVEAYGDQDISALAEDDD